MLSIAGMLCRMWRCAFCDVAGCKPPQAAARRGSGENESDDFTVIRGIGIASQNRLHVAGIKTYADLASTPPEEVRKRLGKLARGAKVDEWISRARELAGKG